MHADNEVVCNATLAALANVSAHVDMDQVSEITSDELDAVMNVMRAKKKMKNVQQNAVVVLKNLSTCRANVMVMERNPLRPSLHGEVRSRAAPMTCCVFFLHRID